MTSLVLGTQSVSAVFCPAVFFYNSPSVKQHCEFNKKSEEIQQANTPMFKRQTLIFIFQRIVQIHVNIYPITHRSDCMRESTAAIVASVIETTWQPSSSSSTTLSRPRANFSHRTCIAGLVKYLSQYTGRISDWMAFVLGHVDK